MVDTFIMWLSQSQGAIVRALAAELRGAGSGAIGLAVALGFLHALTPGHGKAALAAYFLGHEARLWKGVRIALLGAFLHVIMGLAVFLVFKFIIGQLPTMFGRSSPSFAVLGYSLIVVAGAIMLVQSIRPAQSKTHGDRAITAGIGILPCPLTISVLGFAWSQGSAVMIALMVASLAFGIAMTIGLVAIAAITARRLVGAMLVSSVPRIEHWTRWTQRVAGVAIIGIGAYMIATLRS